MTAPSSNKAILLGSGELGKEITLELQNLGIEVIAVDRYANAPAMQVARHSRVINMLDGNALDHLIREEKPSFIIPEIEAISTETLLELEKEGFNIVPTAHAAHLTMNREAIRLLATKELGIKTSSYRFATNKDELEAESNKIGFPCLVKPTVSSSGKGQSIVHIPKELSHAWEVASREARGKGDKVIVEKLIDFDYEITLLTVRHKDGTSFCPPIGHRQEGGDYQESWQPHPVNQETLKECQNIAAKITEALGGYGIFGVEFFIKKGESKDKVFFNEVSPRPHDTGLVTIAGQNLSQFALHVRAILGLPIPKIQSLGAAASAVITAYGHSQTISFSNLDAALAEPDTWLRIFGKPSVTGKRRVGVALARGEDLEEALLKSKQAAGAVKVEL